MPAWILRLIWRVRGKRRVRLHLLNANESFDGILVGKWAGHYVLLTPSVVEGIDASHKIEGHIEVPAANVLFVQVLA